ncbi:MAG: hypothetical protein ACMUEM_03010 [Flavobacteriales bacterium AspAUS03]
MIIGGTDKRIRELFSWNTFTSFKSNFPEAIQQEILRSTEAIVKELRFDYCAFHLEAGWCDKKGFKLIKLSTHPRSGYIASHLVEKSYGIDMYKNLIKISIGQKPVLKHTCQHYVDIRFVLAKKKGILIDFKRLLSSVNSPWSKRFLSQSHWEYGLTVT